MSWALVLVACGDPVGQTETLTEAGSSSGSTGESTNTSTTATPTSEPPTTGEPPTTSEGPTSVTTMTVPATDATTTPDPTLTEPTSISSEVTSTTVDPDDTDTDSDTDSTTGPAPVFTPLALELQDFDGDGEHDILVMGVDDVAGIGGRLSRGNGDGTFAPPVDAGLTGASAFPVVGELDGTPGVDVMVAQQSGEVEVFRWSGDSFTSWMIFGNDNVPLTHVVADAEGDADDDIVWLWFSKDSVDFGLSIRPNDGGGFLAPVDSTLGLVAEFAPSSLVVGRFDADAVADALVFRADTPTGMLRLTGGAQGMFGQPTVVLPTLRPWVANTGDFDEDGDLDLLVIEREPARLIVALGDGLGGFTVGQKVPIAGPFKPFTMTVADLDANGHLDVAVVDDMTAEVRLWAGTGKGSFAGPLATPLPSPAVRVLAAPLDDDAKADLVAATFAAGEVTVLLSP